MNSDGPNIVYSHQPATARRISRARQLREFLRMNGLAVGLVFIAAFLAPCDRWRLTLEIKYSDVFFLAAAASAVLEAFRNRAAIRMPVSFLLTLPVFLFTGLITYYLSDDKADLSEMGHFLISAFGLPLLLAWTSSSSTTAIRTALVGWAFGASFSAFVALLNKHGHFPFGSWDLSVQYTGRFAGMALYHNELAAFSAMVLPVMLMWLFDRRTPRFLRLIAIPLILLNFYAIQLSGSRAGLVSAVAAILAFSYNWLRAQPLRGAMMIIGGLLVLFLSSTVSNCMQVGASTDCTLGAWERLFGGNGTDYSDQVRQRLLDEAVVQLESSPVIGVGFHAVRLSHNILLQLLVSGGVLGLGAFLLYLGTVVAWIKHLRPPEAILLRLNYLVPALYAGFASWVVNGMFQPDTVSRNYYMPIGLLLALRVYCAGLRERELAEVGVDNRQAHAAAG